MMLSDREEMMLGFVLVDGLIASGCCYIKVDHFGRRDLLAPMSSGRDADSRVFWRVQPSWATRYSSAVRRLCEVRCAERATGGVPWQQD